MKNNILVFLLIFSPISLFYSQFDSKNEGKIKGKWEFKVFSDSIGFPIIDNIKTKNRILIDSIEFENDNLFKAKIKSRKVNGKWYILGNNLILNFSNKLSILYEIMRLNNSRLELKEEGMIVPNLGYDRK